MNRRNFTLLTAAGVTAAALPSCFYLRAPEYNSIAADPEILSMIWDEGTILAVGKAYLKENPDENNERNLVNLLTRNISVDADKIQELLQQRIVQDFKQGKMVMVKGWLLSVTEARQCALFSILTPQ